MGLHGTLATGICCHQQPHHCTSALGAYAHSSQGGFSSLSISFRSPTAKVPPGILTNHCKSPQDSLRDPSLYFMASLKAFLGKSTSSYKQPARPHGVAHSSPDAPLNPHTMHTQLHALLLTQNALTSVNRRLARPLKLLAARDKLRT